MQRKNKRYASALYTSPSYQKVRWAFCFAFPAQGRTETIISSRKGRIDISECTFFALLIYQFTIPKKYFTAVLFLHIVCNDPPCRNEMFTKLLQILLFPCGLQPFSMQNGEVYKLHSFSAEVYSFHPCRQFAEKIKSNICTFSSLISAICIFLFVRCFAIIIVYNGVCAEPPCTMMFSILGGEQK